MPRGTPKDGIDTLNAPVTVAASDSGVDERLQRAMEALGVTFRDPSLLRVALVHKSHLNEMG
ncbi:MAG TPA: hypothetical protein VMM78_02845, partial [Thermomicrobiales bacterium]|nr:hypothetical protein [Thermomicrobiales bacterium]